MTRKLLIVGCLSAFLFVAISGCESMCQKPSADKSSCKETTAAPPPAKPTPLAPPTSPKKAQKYVLRVNCGATENYTDKVGNLWVADQETSEGKPWGADDGLTTDRGDVPISGTDAPRVYQSERYSMAAYEFNVPNGKYTVRLHFAETYEGITEAGQRVFSVSINDKVALVDFDVYKVAGGPQKPVVQVFKGVEVKNGRILIGFSTSVENPEINGIEILSE